MREPVSTFKGTSLSVTMSCMPPLPLLSASCIKTLSSALTSPSLLSVSYLVVPVVVAGGTGGGGGGGLVVTVWWGMVVAVTVVMVRALLLGHDHVDLRLAILLLHFLSVEAGILRRSLICGGGAVEDRVLIAAVCIKLNAVVSFSERLNCGVRSASCGILSREVCGATYYAGRPRAGHYAR